MKIQRVTVVAVVGTLCYHLLVSVALLLSPPALPPPPSSKETPRSVPVTTFANRLRMVSEGDDSKDEAYSDGIRLAREKCDGEFYVGIGLGVTYNNTVIQVALGSPAYFAGIQLGDVLLNADSLHNENLKAGDAIVALIRRGSSEMPFRLAVKRICNAKS